MSNDAAPKKIGGEYGSVRASIDEQKLSAYLLANIPVMKGPIDIKQFKFGQSNPTYFLTDSNKVKYVLRKKPAGELISKTAHQIEREYKMLSALHKYNIDPSTPEAKKVPIPEPIWLCEDSSIIGTPFYVMEFLDGRIFTDPRMPEVDPQTRREWQVPFITLRALANLGSLDPFKIGLAGFGPTKAYFARQIKSLGRVSKAQAAVVDIESGKPVGDIPRYDDLIAWYTSHAPDESRFGTRIVHGDYKLDNMIFHPTENKVIGILDWELCTLGNPLADLANMTTPWSIDNKDVPKGPYSGNTALMNAFKNNEREAPIALEDIEKEYCRLSNLSYPIPEMPFVRSWMLFRLAVISQGIAARYARRQASSASAHVSVDTFPVLGNLAKIIVEESGYKFDPKAKL
ncbi:hypothetical protein ONZ45_g12012 [Pleurotus djamor]|nr:hypothetical protein ONZ45_g12012 [Pleurotus djamor]